MNAGDPDRTVRLVEQHGCALLMGGELVTLADWLAAIDPYTLTRPWLAMQKAWVLSLSGQPERAEMAIDDGEQLISTLELTDEVRTLRGSFSAARAQWANTQGKTEIAVRVCQTGNRLARRWRRFFLQLTQRGDIPSGRCQLGPGKDGRSPASL